MRSRTLGALLTLLASPVVCGVFAPHGALASTSLSYDIEGGNDGASFTVEGPPGHSSGTPTYADFYCAGNYGSTYSGWTASGSATTRPYASADASEADTRAPGSVTVTLTDGLGDKVRISGVGVFDNNDDILIAGSFKIAYTASNGTVTTCMISGSGGQSTGESELE